MTSRWVGRRYEAGSRLSQATHGRAGLADPARMKIDLLVSVLGRAVERGATAADGFVLEESRGSASVRMGEIETVTHSRDQPLSLRVFAGRASPAAPPSDFSRASLDRPGDEAP